MAKQGSGAAALVGRVVAGRVVAGRMVAGRMVAAPLGSQTMPAYVAPTAERQRHYWQGLLAEVLAAVRLVLAGYCILAWRYRSPVGEIDLIAVRGRRLVFVEVKHRATVDQAIDSITARQRHRVIRAAALWQKQHRAFRHHEPAFDAIFLSPGQWPRYWRDAFPFAGA
jgi:putative endonuclease